MATKKSSKKKPSAAARKSSGRGKKSSAKVATATKGADQFYQLRPEEMQGLLEVLERNKSQLLARKGVFYVDVGYRWKDGKMTGEIAIRAHVHEKKQEEVLAAADVVPENIEGFPVDVIESNPELHRNTRRNPLIGGVATRNVNLNVQGTLGAVVFDAGFQPLALSNHHVYVRTRPNNGVNDRVNQPGTTTVADTIGNVVNSNEPLDCAVALLNGSRPASTSILDFPGGIKGVVEPAIGMRVTKSGLTTATTFGMVEGASADEFTIVPVPGQFQEISMPGDSGSIWLERSSHAAVGLHYAGETSTAPQDERAFAKRISRVANTLNIRLRRKATLSDTSNLGPALTTLGGQLLLGWVGTDLRLNFMASANGLTFSNKVTLSERSSVPLALEVFQNRFVTAWIGVGNNQLNILQSADGRTWGQKITLSDTSQSAPALAVFGGMLYLAWRGVGNNRLNVIRSSDGVNWRDKVTLGDTTNSGPCLTALDSRLLLGWRGVGNNLLNVIQSSNGTSFGSKVTLGDTTTSKPDLHVHRGRAYLAWQGVGNLLLNVMESTNGTSWGNKITLRETCIDGPALSTLGENFVWGWTGTDPQHRLNTLLYDLRT